MDASDLDMELISDGLEFSLLGAEFGKLDMNRGTESGTEIGGAGGDVAEMFIVSKLGDFLDLSRGDC